MSNLQYIESAKKEFEYYKLLAEKTFGQLTDDQNGGKETKNLKMTSALVKNYYKNGK
jgi:hypothetical protein